MSQGASHVAHLGVQAEVRNEERRKGIRARQQVPGAALLLLTTRWPQKTVYRRPFSAAEKPSRLPATAAGPSFQGLPVRVVFPRRWG